MPEQIEVPEFVKETWDDFNSPTTSSFITKLGHCRNTVAAIEELLDGDRSGLVKMKKTTKALFSTGNSHLANDEYLAENLEKLGHAATHKEKQSDIGAAFLKFAVVTKELSSLMKNLMTGLNNCLLFPLETILKGDIKGVKGDLRKPLEKAWKDYETKFSKIEKEKKQLAKDAGMIKTEVTGAEIAEEMEKERRIYQLQMTEYLIKVNDIRTRKGADLLQHLVEYYHLQMNYFSDGLKTIEHFKCYIEELVTQLSMIKQQQDAERKDLVELRDTLKGSMTAYSRESVSVGNQYNLHQLQGNKEHGFERTGYLLKKSEGKMRKVWQKRKCIVKDGFLSISHSDVSKEPVKLNLLTCQVKLIFDDPGRKCFDLISSSKNRTYHFQADDTEEMEAWISVLNNAKESVLMKAFGEANDKGGSPSNPSVKELTRTILEEVKRLPGNRYCCDCGAPDPEWLSVNLGVLICLECCGVHREMGVHISRTQSIVIDDLGTSQLLLARVVSNRSFNEIMEATLDIKYKPSASSDMEERKNFIRAKYGRKRYAIITCTNVEDRKLDLKQAILLKDLLALLQVYAEGIDFMEPLPDSSLHETALHLAISEEDNRSLYMVDFIMQNTSIQFLTRQDSNGDNCLHYCARLNKPECMKLLLRIKPDLANYDNHLGQTPLELARDRDHTLCVELINHALAGKSEMFSNVNIDWGLVSDEHSYDDVDYSDDDLDKVQTPDRKSRSRPGSLVTNVDMALSMAADYHGSGGRERAGTADSCKSSTLPKDCLMAPPSNDKHASSKGLYLPTGLSGSTQSLVSQRKKAPAPPPPTYKDQQRHSRKHSDPGFGFVSHHYTHHHSLSDTQPPPLPEKLHRQPSPNNRPSLPAVGERARMRRRSYAGMHHLSALMNLYHRRTASSEAFCYTIGAKLVLPPPPQFRSSEHTEGEKPTVAPRPSKAKPRFSSQSTSEDYVTLDKKTGSLDIRKSNTQSTSQEVSEGHHLTDLGVSHSVDGYSGSYFTVGSHGRHPAASGHTATSGYLATSGHTATSGHSAVPTAIKPLDTEHFKTLHSSATGLRKTSNGTEHQNKVWVRERGGSTDSQGSSSSREGYLSAATLRSNARCRALYDCDADNEDELSFREGEVIVVIKEEEEEWWEGYIENEPLRRGIFPTTFVELIRQQL